MAEPGLVVTGPVEFTCAGERGEHNFVMLAEGMFGALVCNRCGASIRIRAIASEDEIRLRVAED